MPASIETLRPVGMELVEGPSRPQRPLTRSARKISVLDNAMRVTTPENISFEYRLAGPFQRLLAYLVDVLVTVAGFGAVAFLVFLLLSFIVQPLAAWLGLSGLMDTIAGASIGMLLILYFLVYWFYGAFMETCFNGQTLGKRASRLRVLSVNGHAIDGVQATLRNFFRLLDVWPAISLSALVDFRNLDADFEMAARTLTFPTFLVALTVMSLSRRFQRVGDLVADTVVVIDAPANRPNLMSFSDPRVVSLAEWIPRHFTPSIKLTKAIASYVDLRRNVHPQRANEIAAHVAVPLMEKFGIPSDTNYDLFLCALYYRTFIDANPEAPEQSSNEITTSADPRQNFLPSATLTKLQHTARRGVSPAEASTTEPASEGEATYESR